MTSTWLSDLETQAADAFRGALADPTGLEWMAGAWKRGLAAVGVA